MKNKLLIAVTCTLLAMPMAAGAVAKNQKNQPKLQTRGEKKSSEWLKKEVGHQLRMLPYYSVFDNLEYKIDGYHVVLLGEVTQPALKSDAAAAVKQIEGVEGVTDNIEVLPLSPQDDRIRLACYQAVYSSAPLQKYSVPPVPSIHIIVKNGHITLEGVVDSVADRNVAAIQANQVNGAFSVTNHLRVGGQG